MLLFVFKNVIISIIIIILIHHIYDYFKCSLTVPKIKDLVNKPDIQYNEIINTIKKCNIESQEKGILKNNFEIKEKKKEVNNKVMKDELQKFMLELDKKKEPEGLTSDLNFGSDNFQSF